MAENEEWKAIADFPDYAVSSLGRVKRITDAAHGVGKAGDIRTTKPGTWDVRPYLCVRLSRDAVRTTRHVHVLVCRAFNGEPPSPKHEVAHRDDDPLNCRADNLRWATHAENMADVITNGGHPNRGVGKVTAEQVIEIRRLLAKGKSQRKIAEAFSVSRGVVDRIHRGTTWSWLA